MTDTQTQSLQRWKLTIEYDGIPYCGWQIQDDERTVQGEIIKAIAKTTQENVDLIAAGRTDSGVHAYGQVAHFDIAKDFDEFTMRNALNAHLRGQAISILTAEKVATDFHARFSAKQRHYRYQILARPAPIVALKNRAWHVYRPLDLDKMREAATHLVGTHDFTSFRAAACQAKSPIRTIDDIRLEVEDYINDGQVITIFVSAKSFLHHQVRNITGTLIMVGKGKLSPDDMIPMLQAKDRQAGGMTAPAYGLYFEKIDY